MKLEQSWEYTLSKVAQAMDQSFSKALSTFAITSRDYGILVTLMEYRSLTQIEIGEKMMIDRTTVGQLIDLLTSQNLVQRKQNPNDRRQNLITLTDKGQKVVEQMWEDMRRIEHEAIANLTDWQITIFQQISAQMKEINHESN